MHETTKALKQIHPLFCHLVFKHRSIPADPRQHGAQPNKMLCCCQLAHQVLTTTRLQLISHTRGPAKVAWLPNEAQGVNKVPSGRSFCNMDSSRTVHHVLHAVLNGSLDHRLCCQKRSEGAKAEPSAKVERVCLTPNGCSHVGSLDTTKDSCGPKSCHSCGRVSCGQEGSCCCSIAGSQTNVDGVLARQSQGLGRQHAV